jgi:hypothetical protein
MTERIYFGTGDIFRPNPHYVELYQDGYRSLLGEYRTLSQANEVALKIASSRGCECLSENF